MSDPLDSYRLVGDAAALERAGLFVAEGRLIVGRLLEGAHRIHSVLLTPAAADAMADTFARRPDVTAMVREPAVLEEITGIDFHRGCLALAYRHAQTVSLDTLGGARRILAIEGVGNPDNIGGLFRTAFALGVDAVLLNPTAGDPLYRKAIRTSMGATLSVPYFRADDWSATLDELRRRGFRVFALTPQPEAVRLDGMKVEASQRLVLLVGAEGPGLSGDTLASVVERVRIDIDPRADSLNVVVAAAIALHALRTP
jgi:tRNA G18 (ribose-2'-O)-methylase SpoU